MKKYYYITEHGKMSIKSKVLKRIDECKKLDTKLELPHTILLGNKPYIIMLQLNKILKLKHKDMSFFLDNIKNKKTVYDKYFDEFHKYKHIVKWLCSKHEVD